MKFAISYLEAKNTELFLYSLGRIIGTQKKPETRYTCLDTINQLEDLYDPVIEILSTIRSNPILFCQLIEHNTEFSNSLAEDIVFFLLVDFTSFENYGVNSLSYFKPLFKVRKEYKK